MPRRIAAPQLLHDFRIGKPAGNVAAFVQALAQLCPGDVQHARPFRDLVGGEILVLIFEVDHHVEGHHGDADVGLVLLEEFLGFVGAVERLAVGVFARTGVIAAHDEVGATVILANQCVPDGLARPAHAHGQRQQRKFDRSRRILGREQLITTNTGEVIHVAGFGHAHHGMDQKAGFHLLGGAEGKLLMGAMHGIARLKGDDAAPAQASEFGAKFRRSQSQRAEIIVCRSLCAFEAAADVPGIGLVHGVIRAGMGLAGAIEHGFGFRVAVGLPYVLDVQDGQHDAFGIAQRNFAAARLEGLGEVLADVQRDGHGPEQPAGQLHVLTDAFVVGAIHESAQRGEAAAEQQLEIAKLAGGQVPRGPLARVSFQFVDGFRLGDEINKFSTVWGNKVTARSTQTLWPPGFWCDFSASKWCGVPPAAENPAT